MNLVTGATGIIGSHVVLNLLQNGQEVTAGKRRDSDLSKVRELFSYYSAGADLFAKIKWVDLDIRDQFSIEDALEGISQVYHCAGLVSFDPKDRQKLIAVNETGTRNLVNACLHKKTAMLCHVSSVATIHNLDHPSELREEVFWKRSGRESDYAISKYNAEREVWRGMEEGLNAVIVNPGVVLAPGFWEQSSSRIFELSYKGNTFYTSGLTGYVAASDVAGIMTTLVTRRITGERFILVEGNYSYRDILSHMNACFGKPAPSFAVPRFLLKAVAPLDRISSFFSGRERKITPALINSAFNQQRFISDKIKATLGFHFRPSHGVITEICRYYKACRAKA